MTKLILLKFASRCCHKLRRQTITTKWCSSYTKIHKLLQNAATVVTKYVGNYKRRRHYNMTLNHHLYYVRYSYEIMCTYGVLPFPSNEIIIFNITLRSQAYKYRFWLHSFTPTIKTSILLSVFHSFLSILELRIWFWIKPCHLVDSLRTCKSHEKVPILWGEINFWSLLGVQGLKYQWCLTSLLWPISELNFQFIQH